MKHYIDQFHPKRVAPLLIKSTSERLKKKYSSVNCLPRHGFRLKIDIPAEQSPLSYFSLVKSQTYYSVDLVSRIGLSKSYIRYLLKNDHPNAHIKAKYEPLNTTPFSNQNLSAPYHTIQVLYEERSLLIFTLHDNCPLKLVTSALFNLQTDQPDKLPKLQYFDRLGLEVFPDTPATSWGPVVRDLRQNNITYFSTGFLVFKLKLIGSQSLQSQELFLINLPHQLQSCDACALQDATCQVIGSLILPHSPTYFCDQCYQLLFEDRHDDHSMIKILFA